MRNTTKNITEVLQNSTFSRLVRRANQLNALNAQIQHQLPPLFQGRCKAVKLEENRLFLEVPSAVIRQAVLLQQAVVLQAIQAEFSQVNELEIRVNPDFK